MLSLMSGNDIKLYMLNIRNNKGISVDLGRNLPGGPLSELFDLCYESNELQRF